MKYREVSGYKIPVREEDLSWVKPLLPISAGPYCNIESIEYLEKLIAINESGKKFTEGSQKMWDEWVRLRDEHEKEKERFTSEF